MTGANIPATREPNRGFRAAPTCRRNLDIRLASSDLDFGLSDARVGFSDSQVWLSGSHLQTSISDSRSLNFGLSDSRFRTSDQHLQTSISDSRTLDSDLGSASSDLDFRLSDSRFGPRFRTLRLSIRASISDSQIQTPRSQTFGYVTSNSRIWSKSAIFANFEKSQKSL